MPPHSHSQSVEDTVTEEECITNEEVDELESDSEMGLVRHSQRKGLDPSRSTLSECQLLCIQAIKRLRGKEVQLVNPVVANPETLQLPEGWSQ